MKVRYRWERDECFMLIEAGEITEGHYQMGMLENNRIDGLLSVRFQQINQQSEFCYMISGRQSMVQKFENSFISVEEIKKIMASLNKTAGRLEEFLLNIDSLLLEPEFIYWRDEDDVPEFCYYPEEAPERNFRKNVKTLLQYLLNKINHRDDVLVKLVYGLYQIGIKETFRMQDLMQYLFYHCEEGVSDVRGQEALYENPRFDGEERISEREKKAVKNEVGEEVAARGQRRFFDYLLAFFVVGLALIAVGRLLFILYGERTVMETKERTLYIGVVVAVMIVSGAAVYKLMEKRGEKEGGRIPEYPEINGDDRVMWEMEQTEEERSIEEMRKIEQIKKLEEMRKREEVQRVEKVGMSETVRDRKELQKTGRVWEHRSGWETVGLPPEQGAFSEETCVLGGVFGRSVGGLWFRYQGEETGIEDFFWSREETRVTVGKRMKIPDIGLNWHTVSRRHAVLQVQNGICTVSDCGSTNGTYLDGTRLRREETRVIFPGCEICFADLVFRVEETAGEEDETTVLGSVRQNI